MNHPGVEPHNWRAYEREPIRISHQTCMMVTLFRQCAGHLSDLWMTDFADIQRQHHESYKKAAQQFGLQLEGQDCIAFWMALRDEANRRVQEWEWQCKRLEDEEKENKEPQQPKS